MAYVYRHIRLDKNEPFYIGIGSDKYYIRANRSGKSRNKYWNNIVNKTKYDVEIIMDGISWEVACEKEKELIKLYGRKNNKTGSLVNLTDGGDGAFGVVYSEERNKSISDTLKRKYASGERINALKGKEVSKETREKLSISGKGLKHSNETKLKLSILKLGNKVNLGKKLSKETKDKIRFAHIGKKLSEDHKKKLSESHKGYNMPFEQKIKISNSLKKTLNNFQ